MSRLFVAIAVFCFIGAVLPCPLRSSCVLTRPCYTPEIYSGVSTCGSCCTGNPLCDAALCSNCFKDLSNVCNTCSNPSPVCSCLKSLGESCGGGCGCGCGGDAAKSFVYFPEVQYPLTIIEMNPFYYSTCFAY